MSKTFIEIEIEQADKFRKLLEQVITKLDKLDTGLIKVQQTTRGIDFKVKGIRDLERLGALSTSFSAGASSLKPFQNLIKIAGYIQQTSEALRGVGGTSFTNLVSIMNSLATVDSRMGQISNLTGFKASSLKNFSSTITTLVQLGAKAAKLDTSGLFKLPMIINIFGDILNRVKNFASIGTVLRGGMQTATVNMILSTLTGLVQISAKAGKVQPAELAKINSIFLIFQTVMTTLKRAGGGVLTATSARIALVSINSLSAILKVLATTVKAGSKLHAQELTNLMYNVDHFVTLMKKLKTATSVADIGRSLLRGAIMKGVESFFVSLSVLSNMGAKTPPNSFVNLSTATTDLLALLKKIKGIATIGNVFKGLATGVALAGITELVRMLRTIGKIGGEAGSKMSAGLSTFADMVVKLSMIANSGIFTVGNMLRITAMFVAFSMIAQIPTKMAISEGIINEFIAVGLAMQRIGLALEKVLAVAQKMRISVLRPAILNDLGRMAIIMRAFSKEMRKVIDAIFATEKTFLIFKVKRDPVSPEQIAALAKLIGSMGRALELITQASKRVGVLGASGAVPLNNLDRIRALFGVLKQGVSSILKVLEDTRPLFKRVLGIGAGAPDAKNMEALAKLLTSLSSIIRRVFASMNSFTGGHFDVRADSKRNVDARIKFLKDLVNSFRGFTGKTLPPNLSPVLAKVPEILKALAQIDSAGGGKASQNLKASVQGLKEFFNTLSKLNVKKTQALGDLGAALKLFGSIKALGSMKGLIDSVNQIVLMVNSTKIDRGSFKGLKGAAEEISKALRVLEKVKVTQTQVDAVRAMAQALASITKTKIQPLEKNLVNMPKVRQTGFETGKELSEAVERGVLSGNLHLALLRLYTQVGLKILRAINPAALVGTLVNGLQSIYHFGSQVVNIFDRVENAIRNLGTRISTLGDQMRTLGTNLNTSAGLGTLMNTQAFTNAVDFDQLLTQVQVFGNLTTEELEQVRSAAVQVGIDFPQSAAEGLQAGLNLIKAGLGPAAVEATLPVAAALASLSESGDLDRISKGIIQVVNSFEELTPTVTSSFDNAAVVADILASAADNSTASIESLMDGLQNVGPAAATFGLDLEQTTAILALFQQNGIEGAEAGTQLRTVLRTLQSDGARSELQRLGVSLTDSEGNFRSLIDIVGDLNTAMNTPRNIRQVVGLTPADQALMQDAQRAYASASRNIRVYQNDLQAAGVTEDQRNERLEQYTRQQQSAAEAIARLSGNANTATSIMTQIDRTQAENARTILNLAGAYGQLGLSVLLSGDENAIQDFIDQMNAMPPAVDRARQMLDNFKGDVQQLQGSLETAGIVGLQPLLDVYFRPMVQVLRHVVDGFLALPAPIQEAVGWFVALGSTLATLVGSALILSGALTSLGGGVISILAGFLSLRSVGLNILSVFTGMATGLATVVFVALPLVAALGAVALGISAFRKVVEENIGNAGQVFDRLKGSVGALFGTLRLGVGAFTEFFAAIFTGSRNGSGDTTSRLLSFGEALAVIFARIDSSVKRFNTRLVAFITGFRRFTDVFETGFEIGDRFVRGQMSNPLLAWLFGNTDRPPMTMESMRAFLQTLQLAAGQIRLSLKGIGDALGAFVTNLRDGISLGDAFATLQTQLQFGVSSLAGGVLKLVGELFNIDFSAATQFFDQGNLEDGVKTFLSIIVEKIRSVLLNNRDTISNVLVTIFDNLFIPGKMLERIAGWLGLTDIETVIRTIREAISTGFRGVVETLFNILAGDDIRTALTKAFGPGIEPVFAFVEELGKAVQNISGIITGLIKAVFNPDIVGAEGLDIGGLISSALGAASSILKGLNDTVLGPLSATINTIDFHAIGAFFQNLLDGVSAFLTNVGAGDWEAAAAGLGGALAGIIKTIRDVVTGFFNAAGGEGSGSFVKSVGAAIVGALQGAITFAFGTLATSLGLDPAQFYADIAAAFAPLVTAIQTGDPFAIVGGLGTAVVKAIGAAINLALSGISELLGIDTTAVQTFIRDTLGGIVDQINVLFSGEEGSLSSSVLDLIRTFVDLLQTLFATFQSVGSSDNAQSILTSLSGFFTSLSSTVLNVVAVPLNALRILMQRISDMDATSVQLIMTAIGGVLAVLAAQSLVSNLASLTTFIRTASAPVLTGAAIFVLVDFLANLITNIRELGDLSTTDLPHIVNAILNSFVGLGADIVSTLGFYELADQIRGLKDTFLEVAAQFPIVAARFGAIIEFEVRRITNGIIAGIQRTFAEAKVEIEAGVNTLAGRGETFEGFRFAFNDQLQQALDSQGGSVDLGAFFRNVVTQASVNGFDIPEALRQEFIAKARQSLGDLMLAFQTDLAESTATEDQGAMRQTISDWFLLITGIGDPAFAFDNIFQSGDFSFVQNMIDTLGTMTAEEMANSNIDSTVVAMLASSIQDAFNRGLLTQQQAFSLLQGEIFTSMSPDEAARIRAEIEAYLAQVQAIVDETVAASEPVIVKGRIQPSAGKEGAGKGEDPNSLATQLLASSEAFVRLREEATISSQQVALQLGLMSLIATPMVTLLEAGLADVRNRFSEIGQRLLALSTNMLITVPIVLTQGAVLQTGFTTLANSAVSDLDKLIMKLNEVKSSMDGILSTLGLINAYQPPAAATGGGSRTTTPQRALGGSTNAGQVYQVLEGGQPELYKSGSNYYMLSPADGRVIPLMKDAPKVSKNYGGSSQVVVNYNPQLVIQVNGANVDINQLNAQIQNTIRKANAAQREDIDRMLRLRGRSGS